MGKQFVRDSCSDGLFRASERDRVFQGNGLSVLSKCRSRSAFAECFTSLVGMPPMRYLTRWRLQLAALCLRESPRSLGRIAYDVGYESEAAFSRAFKSAFGIGKQY